MLHQLPQNLQKEIEFTIKLELRIKLANDCTIEIGTSTKLHNKRVLDSITFRFIESQLSAHHICINNVPEVITDAAINIVVADLYSALPH